MGSRRRRNPHGRSFQGKASAASPDQQAEAEERAELSQQAREAEVLEAVASLYDDQLKPYGRIIRKRLVEQRQTASDERGPKGEGPASAASAPLVGAEGLKELCEACDLLTVEEEAGGEFSALLRDREPDFVDIYCDDDPFPAALWREASEYFEGQAKAALDAEEPNLGALPGGRYASASDLADRRLPFLEGLSLGQVCHFVQLAICKKAILGYLNGAVVPYVLSTSMAKAQCAQKMRPAGSSGEANVVEWDIALKVMAELLEKKNGGPVPLSNVKRLFRSEYRLELSETALGHSKISDLLADRRFRGICEVRLVNSGYMVFPAAADKKAPADPAPSSKASAMLATPDKLPAPRRQLPSPLDCGSKEATAAGPAVAAATSSPVSPPSTCAAVSPMSDGTASDMTSPAQQSRKKKKPPPPLDAHCLWGPKDCGVDNMIHRTFIHAPIPPPTPMGPGACRRSTSVPMNARLGQEVAAAVVFFSPASTTSSARRRPLIQHANTCPDTKSTLSGGEVLLDYCGAGSACFGRFQEQEVDATAAPSSQEDRVGELVRGDAAEATAKAGSGFQGLSLDGLDDAVDAPLGSFGDFPARTPSPQWGSGKYPGGGRTLFHQQPEVRKVALSLDTLVLGSSSGGSGGGGGEPGVPMAR